MNWTILLLCISFLSPKFGIGQSIRSFSVGKKYELQSSVLHETRTIYIYDTVVGDTTGIYTANLPVIYVLDGDEQFINVATIAKYLAEYEDHAPRVLVVGIWNKDRNRDFTPSYDSTNPTANTGGAYNFGSFIQNELYPFIDKTCHPGKIKVFVGTSFGGLFGVTALTKFPDMFDDYILLDPSFWWHKQKMITELLLHVNENRYAKKSLYISIANTLPIGADTITVRTLGPDTCSMTSVFNFVDKLKLTGSQIQWSYKYFPAEDHWTVFLPSLYEGLRFVYTQHLKKPQ